MTESQKGRIVPLCNQCGIPWTTGHTCAGPTTPEIGSVWLARYTVGLRAVVIETDDSRIRIAALDSDTGQARGRGRWCPINRFMNAYIKEN